VPRRIFGLKRDEIKLHNEGLNNLYFESNIIRMMKSRWMRRAVHVARMGKEKSIKNLMGKPEGNRPVGRPRRRWEDNIKMYLREIGWNGWVVGGGSFESYIIKQK
jgi:hypothetical protein